jgi:hypothetical protein
MVMMPTYETDKKLKIDREKDIPPPKMYMGLGWDENKDTQRKHYRRITETELEDDQDYMSIPSPFYRFNLHRGQARGLAGGTGLFSFSSTNTKIDESGQTSNEHEVGYFKGLISLHNTQTRNE